MSRTAGSPTSDAPAAIVRVHDRGGLETTAGDSFVALADCSRVPGADAASGLSSFTP